MLTPSNPPSNFPKGRADMNFSSVGGGIAGQPVITTIYDLDPFFFIRQVYDRHGMAPSFRQVVDLMGNDFSRGVSAPTTGHYERDWETSMVNIGSVVTAATTAGTQAIVALAAGDMFDSAVATGGSARKASYPRVNDRILLPSGKMVQVIAKNETTDPHRLTLKPINSAQNIAGEIAAGDSYFIVDNAWGEGTNYGGGRLQRLYEYTNTFQIIKEPFGATGSALTTKFFPVFEQDGENIAMILEADMIRRFERTYSNMLLYGQQSNNITTSDTSILGYDVAVSGTEGMITYCDNNAYSDTYTPGSYGIQDVYVVTRIFDQEQIGVKQLCTWDGRDLYVEREQALGTQYSATLPPTMGTFAANQSEQGMLADSWQPTNDKDFIAWLGFKGMHLGGYSIHFRTLEEFTHPLAGGASGYDYIQRSYIMPLGNTVDTVSRQPRAYFGYEWRQLGPYSRKAIAATTAGAGTNSYFNLQYAANGYDSFSTVMIAEAAFHAACGNRIVVQKPA